MSKKLIIIEGAGKISKIKSILGSNYDVLATGGHFRQLKSDGLYNTGLQSDYSPSFELSPLGSKNWSQVKKAISSNDYDTIYIASDPDREGEGIAYHIYQSLPATAKKISKRITYNEISKSAITNAINNPREIDDNLVYAQFTRQGYDKLFGFRASNFVQRKLNLKSIGRVQGVAVKFLGDREKEIAEYKPHYQNTIKPIILDDKENKVVLSHVDSDYKTIYYETNESVPNIENPFVCENIFTSDDKKDSPTSPYITSTFLSEATKLLGVKVKNIQGALQKLYEKGYISYPRTDSKSISPAFFNELKTYLKNNGYADHIRDYQAAFKNSASSQEGHECLRILHPETKPNDSSVVNLGSLEQKVYNLLYHRTMIQGLKDALYQNTDYIFKASNELFKTTSKKYKYLGYHIYPNYHISNDEDLYFKEKNKYNGKIEIKEVNTNPKPTMFNEASLIKELERKGIGRPSTYATFPSILQERKYATIDSKEFKLTAEGNLLYKVIESNFQDFINYDFTKDFEDDLDKIANGKLNYQQYLSKKDKEIDNLVNSEVKEQKVEKQVIISNTEFCETCQAHRIEKIASNGTKFYVCKNFKYDPKTKTSSGCEIKWANKPKPTFKKKYTKKG